MSNDKFLTEVRARLGVTEYEATQLRPHYFAVRPVGVMGTHGWHPIPWEVQFVNAPSAEAALRKAGALRRASK